MKKWKVNEPEQLNRVLKILEKIKNEFVSTVKDGKKISLADIIMLAGNAGVEKAVRDGGFNIQVPFTPGRMDALQEQTDVESFSYLEPKTDGFRNYASSPDAALKAEFLLIDKAQLLTLTVPEMTVLVGGMRVLDANYGHSRNGVFTNHPGMLSNDFFVNILDMGTSWEAKDDKHTMFEGVDRKTGKSKWTATRADLIFGHHSELRAVAEVYGSSDGNEKFVRDFVKVWTKIMNLDRFDIK